MTFICSALTFITLALDAKQRPLTPTERAGQAIYWRGTGIMALLNKGETELAGENFACANCHGSEAEGGSEAGLRVPAVSWSTLASVTRVRPSYGTAHFERALLAGFDSGGRKLSSSMPLYRVTRDQIAALVAYLKIAGSDLDSSPGVSEIEILFGAVLPLTGLQAERGRLIQAAVQARFALVNAAGGVFGRRLTLAVADAGDDPSAAAARLAASGIFAMVASLDVGQSPQPSALIAGTAALVGPLTAHHAAVSEDEDADVFSVLPSITLQAQVLAERLMHTGQPIALVQSSGPLYAAAAAAFASHLAAGGVTLASRPADGWAAYFGPASGWAAFRASLPPRVRTATIAMMMTGEALPTLLASPFPAERSADLRESLGEARSASPLAAWAWASATVAAEACRRSGRRISPRAFREALESLRDFPTETAGPVTFAPHRHSGARGAYLLEFPAGALAPVSSAYLIPSEFAPKSFLRGNR